MNYNDNFSFPPQKLTEVSGYLLETIYPDHTALMYRRKEFHMTQQQVADAAGVTLRQYQKFESGERKMSSATMRIGLSICHVLKLDPYRFVDPPTSE